MQLTILGCSGSVCGPDSPASGYLVTVDGFPPLVLDLGPGTLGALQRHADPARAIVLFSHLHADHCLDFPSLLVWRRYGPGRQSTRSLIMGPSDTPFRLGVASSERAGQVDDFSDTFAFRAWQPGVEVDLGGVSVRAERVLHPPESYGIRVTDSNGLVIAYSGDSADCSSLRDLARDADIFLCEASWESGGDYPEGMHMSGREAGRIAADAGVGTLLLTHIPPWVNAVAVRAEAVAEFGGPVYVVQADETYTIENGHCDNETTLSTVYGPVAGIPSARESR